MLDRGGERVNQVWIFSQRPVEENFRLILLREGEFCL